MKHAKSNISLLKKEKGHVKKNIFKKSSQNYNSIKTNNDKRRKNYLISLLDINSTKSQKSNKFNFNRKNNKKEIYLTSGRENINNAYRTNHHHGNINIRLNLNNEIINNNFNNYYYSTKHKNFHKSRSNINLNEKIKEKDKVITKLQKELLQSQELLNQIQKDKQNELSFTYNTIKKYDKLDKNNNHSLNALLNSPSLLKFNYNNNKRENLKKNDYKLFNSGIYIHHNKKYKLTASSPKSNYIRCFSSSPNRFFSFNLDNLESYNSNFSLRNSLYQKSNNNIKLNKKSNSNIFIKRNEKISNPTELCIPKQLSYSNTNSKNLSKNKVFIDKCENLKKRAKLLLNNYISLFNK